MSLIVDMCRRQRETEWLFSLNFDKWKSVDENVLRIISSGWITLKFLDDKGNLHKDLGRLPSDKGGIYIFILNPDIIPYSHTYIMYIGRAQFTKSINLRTRCRTYLNDMRPKIATMREIWGKELYIKYLPLDDNKIIKTVEKELIRVIIPPFNDEIPDLYNLPKRAAWGE